MRLKYVKGKILKSNITNGGGKQYPSGIWRIVSETDKTIKLQLLKEDLMGGGLQANVEVGDIVTIRKNRWGFEDFGDGTFQLYPNQSGTPHYFEEDI